MSKRRHKLFERTWGFHYMPVTLEGAGCVIGAILVILSIGFLGNFVSNAVSSKVPSYIGWVIAFVLAIGFMRFVHRHSE